MLAAGVRCDGLVGHTPLPYLRLRQIVVREKQVVSIRIADRLDGHAPMGVTHFGSCSEELLGAPGRLAPAEREEQPPASRAYAIPIQDEFGTTASDLHRNERTVFFMTPVLHEPETGVEPKRFLTIGDEEDRPRVPRIDVAGHPAPRWR